METLQTQPRAEVTAHTVRQTSEERAAVMADLQSNYGQEGSQATKQEGRKRLLDFSGVGKACMGGVKNTIKLLKEVGIIGGIALGSTAVGAGVALATPVALPVGLVVGATAGTAIGVSNMVRRGVNKWQDKFSGNNSREERENSELSTEVVKQLTGFSQRNNLNLKKVIKFAESVARGKANYTILPPWNQKFANGIIKIANNKSSDTQALDQGGAGTQGGSPDPLTGGEPPAGEVIRELTDYEKQLGERAANIYISDPQLQSSLRNQLSSSSNMEQNNFEIQFQQSLVSLKESIKNMMGILILNPNKKGNNNEEQLVIDKLNSCITQATAEIEAQQNTGAGEGEKGFVPAKNMEEVRDRLLRVVPDLLEVADTVKETPRRVLCRKLGLDLDSDQVKNVGAPLILALLTGKIKMMTDGVFSVNESYDTVLENHSKDKNQQNLLLKNIYDALLNYDPVSGKVIDSTTTQDLRETDEQKKARELTAPKPTLETATAPKAKTLEQLTNPVFSKSRERDSQLLKRKNDAADLLEGAKTGDIAGTVAKLEPSAYTPQDAIDLLTAAAQSERFTKLDLASIRDGLKVSNEKAKEILATAKTKIDNDSGIGLTTAWSSEKAQKLRDNSKSNAANLLKQLIGKNSTPADRESLDTARILLAGKGLDATQVSSLEERQMKLFARATTPNKKLIAEVTKLQGEVAESEKAINDRMGYVQTIMNGLTVPLKFDESVDELKKAVKESGLTEQWAMDLVDTLTDKKSIPTDLFRKANTDEATIQLTTVFEILGQLEDSKKIPKTSDTKTLFGMNQELSTKKASLETATQSQTADSNKKASEKANYELTQSTNLGEIVGNRPALVESHPAIATYNQALAVENLSVEEPKPNSSDKVKLQMQYGISPAEIDSVKGWSVVNGQLIKNNKIADDQSMRNTVVLIGLVTTGKEAGLVDFLKNNPPTFAKAQADAIAVLDGRLGKNSSTAEKLVKPEFVPKEIKVEAPKNMLGAEIQKLLGIKEGAKLSVIDAKHLIDTVFANSITQKEKSALQADAIRLHDGYIDLKDSEFTGSKNSKTDSDKYQDAMQKIYDALKKTNEAA